VIIHTTDGGESWTPQVSNVTVPLHSVDFVDSLNGWAVGLVVNNEGTILHTTDGGVNWVWQGNGQRTAMYDIEFLDLQTGIAVGGESLILRTTDEGETWTNLHEGTGIFFWDIECIDDSTWYIAGQYNINPGRPPAMFHTTDAGQTWSVLAEDGDWGLQSVSFTDPLNGWAAGWFGEIIHTTDGGETWAPQESGRTDEILFEVVFRDQNIGWTVGGERGCQLWDCDSLLAAPNVLLLTTDGGNTWDLQPPLTDQLYVKIYFYSPDTAWIVGDGGTILRTTDATSVIPASPNQPSLLQPTDSAVVTQDSVTFLWQSESGVEAYWVEYDTTSTFLSSVIDSTLTDTSNTVVGLEDNTKFWWRVRGRNAFAWGPFSELRQFFVDAPLATPDSVILLQPADGVTNQLTPLTLVWGSVSLFGSDSICFHLQLSTEPAFSSILLQDSTLIDTTYQLDSLDFGGTYYWRVRALSAGIPGPWSEGRLFTTPDISSIPCLVVSRLLGGCRPDGTLVLAVALVNFKHTGDNVVIAIDGVQYLGQMGSNRRAQISVPGFAPGTHTVELVNPGGCLDPVNISCGALANRDDGEDESESLEWDDEGENLLEPDLPATTDLLGSYPNPFNSVTTIAFQLAEQIRVDLRIFDILGREIETIVNEELPAGRYSRTWTATAHASGLYFYRFTVGNSVLTGKLIQVK